MFFAQPQESVGGSTSPFFGNKSTSSCSLHWHTSSFLLLTSKVLRFQRGGRAQVAILFPALVSSGPVTLPSHVASWCNCSPYAANASVWLTDFQPWRSWNLDCIMLQNMQRQASPPLFETWEVLILAGAKTATSQGKNTAKLTIMNSPSRSFSCIPTSGWKARAPAWTLRAAFPTVWRLTHRDHICKFSFLHVLLLEEHFLRYFVSAAGAL